MTGITFANPAVSLAAGFDPGNDCILYPQTAKNNCFS